MNEFKTKLEIEALKALTYTQINELLNKLTLENKELKEQLRIGSVSNRFVKFCDTCEHETEHRVTHACLLCDGRF